MRTALLVGAVLLLGSLAGRAQNYQPFTNGATYHYSYPDTGRAGNIRLYTFRVDSVRRLSSGYYAPKLYVFNKTIVDCYWSAGNVYERFNVFGGSMEWRSGTGIALFRAEVSRPTHQTAEVELHTRGPIGTSWTFTTLPRPITATLLARQVEQVAGTADTVLTIGLSDSATIRLSRRFGWLSGPNLSYYFRHIHPLDLLSMGNAGTRRQLELAGVPEWGMGTVDERWQGVYDFQPGDRFYYLDRNSSWSNAFGPNITDSGTHWRRTTVLSRNGFTYDLRDEVLVSARHTQQDGPNTIVFDTTFTMPANVYQRTYGAGYAEELTRAAYNHGCDNVYPATSRPDIFYGRPVTVSLYSDPVNVSHGEYAMGLGVTYSYGSTQTTHNSGSGSRQLIGYVKGTEVWGDTVLDTRNSVNGLAREQAAALPATLAPNPADAAETPELIFHLEKAQTVTLALYDATGREIWRRQEQLSGGEQRLPLEANLAPGLYRLHLMLADGRQRVLPLVRQ